MINPRPSIEAGSILAPQDAQRLRQACPDLDEWPRKWCYEPADIAFGEQIVAALTPFLLHLLNEGLSKTTIRRHRDNLWLLGGEIIRRRYDDKRLARKDAYDALQLLIESDGGPLMHPSITESEQNSLDATCRKLHRFLRQTQISR